MPPAQRGAADDPHAMRVTAVTPSVHFSVQLRVT
jgi:hypothetical protein